MRKFLSFIFALSVSLGISACLNANQNVNLENQNNQTQSPVSEFFSSNIAQNQSQNIDNNEDIPNNDKKKYPVKKNNPYSDKDSVALYIHYYKKLPPNYITKQEAQKLGWESSKGNLHEVAPGKSIGGDRFGNYEKLLPIDKKRKYFECDIDYEKGRRNAKRIIFSNDGLIYYTQDHYKSFEKIY
ncbi:MAG: hypothetical protein IKR41_10355 [Bacteroidales bacterium]|nr:hypothetical protein [Bacteroidales bacterium]